MILDIQSKLDYALGGPTSAILQIEAAAMPDQRILESEFLMTPNDHFGRVPADEGVGERITVSMTGPLQCTYTAKVEIDRPAHDISRLPATPVHLLPGPAIRYLMGSRFCPSDEFQSYVASEFGDTAGGARIAALRDWIREHIAYVSGQSHAGTTALETFVQRQGVCRDFAHLMITLARASGVPARMASVYAPNVTPPDFHAAAEVYLDGAWHLVDATGMATADEMARICVGRDAADVAFLTVYGIATLQSQSVTVTAS